MTPIPGFSCDFGFVGATVDMGQADSAPG